MYITEIIKSLRNLYRPHRLSEALKGFVGHVNDMPKNRFSPLSPDKVFDYELTELRLNGFDRKVIHIELACEAIRQTIDPNFPNSELYKIILKMSYNERAFAIQQGFEILRDAHKKDSQQHFLGGFIQKLLNVGHSQSKTFSDQDDPDKVVRIATSKSSKSKTSSRFTRE